MQGEAGFEKKDAVLETGPVFRWPARIAFAVACWGAAAVLLLGRSDLEWAHERGYSVIAERYSTERAALIGALFLAGWTPILPRLMRAGRVRAAAETMLVLGYSLTAFFAFSEYFFHHNPRWIFGGTHLTESWQFIFVGQSEMVPDPELGRRGPPNLNAPSSHATLFNIRHLYDPATWAAGPDPRVDYVSDSEGFRNAAPPGPVDLMVVGDSFTHAPLVERDEIWSSIVAASKGWTERNLGLSGYGPPQEAIVLDRYTPTFQPRIVLMQVFLGNDIHDSLEFQLWKDSGKTYRAFMRDRYDLPRIIPTWEWLRGRVLGMPRRPPETARSLLQASAVRVGQETVRSGFEPSVYLLTKTEEEFAAHPGMPPLLEGIVRGASICQDRGAWFGVVIVPIKLRILFESFADDAERDRTIMEQRPRPEVRTPGDLVDLILSRRDSQNRVIQAFLAERGIPCLDLTETLVQTLNHEGVLPYFPMDSHWNAAGHAAAARAVGEWLDHTYDFTPQPALPGPRGTP